AVLTTKVNHNGKEVLGYGYQIRAMIASSVGVFFATNPASLEVLKASLLLDDHFFVRECIMESLGLIASRWR
ncbi:MAG: hypothetical protein ABIJ17_02195, partial [Patescibacteria group bacterium]